MLDVVEVLVSPGGALVPQEFGEAVDVHAVVGKRPDELPNVRREVIAPHARRSNSRRSGTFSPYARRRSSSASRSRSSSDMLASCSRSHASASEKPLAR